MKRLRAVLIAGLVVYAAGIVLYFAFRHHHQICIAPYEAVILASHPPPSRGDCTVVNALFYLGVGTIPLGAVLALGAAAAMLRRRGPVSLGSSRVR